MTPLMLCCIADDLTGAAEVAGVGLRHGLRVMLDAPANPSSIQLPDPSIQLWVLALDTRAMLRQQATSEVHAATMRVVALGMRRFFKKTDSAMRGHIAAELDAMLNALGKPAAVLCPVNPETGRSIKNGTTYYVNDLPLHETAFAHDPEFPAITSNVYELLGEASHRISIPPVSSLQGLREAAASATEQVLPAGSAAFFEAWLLLQQLPQPAHLAERKPSGIAPHSPTLVVCGSAFGASRERIGEVQRSGMTVCHISPLLADSPQLAQHLQQLSAEAAQAVARRGCAVVAIGEPVLGGRELATALRKATATLVEQVWRQVNIDELVVEGGATALAVARQLGWTSFVPVQELAPGMVRMNVVNSPCPVHLTIKPGSYAFSEGILKI
jgi:uncharacterized protein YgbK (DUF1537 family)